jgi:membrane dipeptidase
MLLRFLPLLFITSVAGGQSLQRLHNKAIVVDSHNDIITACIEKNVRMDQDLRGKTHSDLQRMKEGGLDVQIFSVWCDGEKPAPFQFANREMDLLDDVIKNNPDKIALTRTTAEMEQAVKEKKIAALFGVEGGHMIENSLEKLEQLYARGARYLTLTWNKEVVKRMNRLGMMVDLSHVGEQTFWDAIATTRSPVIVSHSNAWSICPVPRNLKDDQILAVGKNGGVIALNFYSGFVDSTYKKKEALFQQAHKKEIDSLIATGVQTEYALTLITEKYAAESDAARPSLEQLLAHLDHIVGLIGSEHVGIGSDFDGISSSPKGLEDVTSYPLLTSALIKRGFTKQQVYNILGGNIIRVWKANEAGAGK